MFAYASLFYCCLKIHDIPGFVKSNGLRHPLLGTASFRVNGSRSLFAVSTVAARKKTAFRQDLSLDGGRSPGLGPGPPTVFRTRRT